MLITLAAIGKLKSGPELALFEHYIARMPWKITVKEYDIKKPLGPDARKKQEGELLWAAIKDAEHIVALDEHGRDMGSNAFATHLKKQRDLGARTLAFVIGGADGLHETVTGRAHLTLSFGRLTWPHMLVRGLLAEQLYRAHTIMTGHPYHRE